MSFYEKELEGTRKLEFEAEVEGWIEEGILQLLENDVNETLMPLIAFVQPTENKTRPVMDLSEFNAHVKCHTGRDIMESAERC